MLIHMYINIVHNVISKIHFKLEIYFTKWPINDYTILLKNKKLLDTKTTSKKIS